jgi:hypothetical protein
MYATSKRLNSMLQNSVTYTDVLSLLIPEP